MDRITHILEPHGDVLIVLRNPKGPCAVHDETDPKVSTIDETWDLDTSTTAWPEERNEDNIGPEPTYLVSARKTGLYRLYSYSEGYPKAGPQCRVEDLKKLYVRGIDEFGLLMLLRGVYFGTAPREMSTATIGRLLVAAGCFMSGAPDGWGYLVLSELQPVWRGAGYGLLLRHPHSITRPLVVLLHTFLEGLYFDLFEKCVAAVIQYADGLLPRLGLVFPQALINRIDLERKKRLHRIIMALHRLVKNVTHRDLQLKFGDFLKTPVKDIRQFPPIPGLSPFDGISCADILDRAKGLRALHQHIAGRPEARTTMAEKRVPYGSLTYAKVAAIPPPPGPKSCSSAKLCRALDGFIRVHDVDEHNVNMCFFSATGPPQSC